MAKPKDPMLRKTPTLKMAEALSNVDVQMREVCDQWILITYDLPNTEEGQKARSKFLHRAERIGAVQHTESVYLMPWTPESELCAVEVASIGRAFLWVSSIKDENRAKELTEDYDAKVEAGLIKEVRERIAKMQEHAQSNIRAFERMKAKTFTLLDESAAIAARRGSTRLIETVANLRKEVNDIIPAASSSIWEKELGKYL